MTTASDLEKRLIRAQQNEMTEHVIYHRLALAVKNAEHAEVLKKISADELSHHDIFQGFTRERTRPQMYRVIGYLVLARIFGLNFALRLMEGGEDMAQDFYATLMDVSPEIKRIIKDEERHESQLLDLIDEERLTYISSMVLGLNDALVELTGALVGFTLALQNSRLIAVVGLITGIAASMSMSASEYLSTKHEDTAKNPLKASIYTGSAYVLTVVVLVLPYFFLTNVFVCMGLVVGFALLIVFFFTFYISVAKGLNFKKRFLEMAGISLGIATVNFGIGLIIRRVFGVEI